MEQNKHNPQSLPQQLPSMIQEAYPPPTLPPPPPAQQQVTQGGPSMMHQEAHFQVLQAPQPLLNNPAQSLPVESKLPAQEHVQPIAIVPLLQKQQQQQQGPPPPLLEREPPAQSQGLQEVPKQDPQPQQSFPLSAPFKSVITKVKLSEELNIFDWFRTTDIINQIAEKARSSVDSVITVLDPGMREYLFSGGNISVIVIDCDHLVGSIRNAFLTVFGRATVISAAKLSNTDDVYPIKLACGFKEAIKIAQEKLKKYRSDTSNVPQNQVLLTIQPGLVTVDAIDTTNGSLCSNGLKLDDISSRWFLTYTMLLEDPVLGVTISSCSQLIPIDADIVEAARAAKFPENFSSEHSGFAESIDQLMTSKLNLTSQEMPHEKSCEWLRKWSGLEQTQVIHDVSISLAHIYKRKWNTVVR